MTDEQMLRDRLVAAAAAQDDLLPRALADDVAAGRSRLRRHRLAAGGGAVVTTAVVGAVLVGVNSWLAPPEFSPAPPVAGTSGSVAQDNESGISIDVGPLTQAQTAEFAEACSKMIGATDPSKYPDQLPAGWPDGGAKLDAILHPTVIRSAWDSKATDWTVVIKSGGKTYGCIGRLTKTRPDGSTTFGYDFATFAPPGKQGMHGTAGTAAGGGGTVVLDQKPDKVASDRWIEVGSEVATVRQRFVLKGKPGQWFTTKVVDGLAFIRAWDQATLNVGDTGRLETQLLDKSGQPLDYPSGNGKTLALSGTVTAHTPVLVPGDKNLGDLLLR